MTWAYDSSLACRALIGVVFAVSVVSKVRSRTAWRAYSRWLAGIPLGSLGRAGWAGSLAGAEAIVVLLVAVPAVATAGLVAGTLLSLALTAGLAMAVRAGASEPCYCFGRSVDPLGGLDVARNAVLAGLTAGGAVAAFVSGQPAAGAEPALAVITGLAFALLIIFFRDLASLFTPGSFAASGPAPRPGRHLGRP